MCDSGCPNISRLARAKRPSFTRARGANEIQVSSFYPPMTAPIITSAPHWTYNRAMYPAEKHELSATGTADPGGTATQKRSTPELKKPHEMIVLKPRTGRVTLTGRRLYNAMLHAAQVRLEAMPDLPRADFLFDAPLGALLRVTGGTGEERTAAKRYLREMRGIEVDWETTAPGDGVKWRGFSMLSEVNIEVRNGENWVTWAYPPAILGAIKEPQRWARINLLVLSKLSTYAALALYEICVRYRDNPSFVTSRKTCDWWIDALSAGPPGEKRREWRKFKNETLQPAVEEVSSATDLQVELIEHKRGRQIVEVQFAVHKRKQVVAQQPQAADADVILLGTSLGLTEERLDRLVQQFGDRALREELQGLAGRLSNRSLAPIHDRYAYLRTVLTNGFRPISALEGSVLELAKTVGPPVPSPATTAPGVPTAATAPSSDAANTLIDEIKRKLSEMSNEQREPWVQLALDSLSERRLLTATLRRRAEQGDNLHGMLGYAVVQAYAREVMNIDLAAL